MTLKLAIPSNGIHSNDFFSKINFEKKDFK